MLYFTMGFIFAIILGIIFVVIAHDTECSKNQCDDKFQVYYSKGEGMNSRLWNNEYKKVIRGPMADDIYKWLTGNREFEEDGE